MISMSVLVGEAVLTSILMSLIVENVCGVWPLSWTLTRQALQSLRLCLTSVQYTPELI